MGKGYTDNWGDECTRIDLSDWSEWSLWTVWADKFNWRCGADFNEQDVIVWREPILVNLTARKPHKPNRWTVVGERLVIGHVRQFNAESSGWIYITVIHSEGGEPLKRDEKIKRREKNIRRNGVKRWPRNGVISTEESADFHRAPDAPINAAGGNNSRRNIKSRFLPKLGYRQSTPPHKPKR